MTARLAHLKLIAVPDGRLQQHPDGEGQLGVPLGAADLAEVKVLEDAAVHLHGLQVLGEGRLGGHVA